MTLPIENHLIFNINGFEIVIISKRCKYRVKRMRRMRFCLMPFNDEVERFHLIRHRLSRRDSFLTREGTRRYHAHMS